MQEQLFILAGNGPYENRGCEAIVRGTVKILSEYFESPKFLVHSHFVNRRQLVNQIQCERDQRITHSGLVYAKRYSPSWFCENIIERLSPRLFREYLYKGILRSLPDAKAVLSIGGDNYSLDYGNPKFFLDLNELVISKKKPMVLWGASVGPFSNNPEYEEFILEHLRKVTIFARESETVKYLASKGLKDNVFRVADPAFLMDAEEPPVNKWNFKIEEGAIGVNLSPLMASYVTSGDIKSWIKESAKIVESISVSLKRPIYLIPHVTLPGNDDYEFMKTVLSLIAARKENITLIPSIFNAAETKWIISKMFVFVGARTHATIAALSTNIPTLSLSYSIKSLGINDDFYNDRKFCLEKDAINAEKVVPLINVLIDNNREIRKKSAVKNLGIKKLAYMNGEYLSRIIQFCR